MAGPAQIPPEVAERHWRLSRRLMLRTLALWLVGGLGIHAFVRPMNEIVILGFPLGFYAAAQGSLIIFLVLIFWFAHRQNRIDEDCGVAEDE